MKVDCETRAAAKGRGKSRSHDRVVTRSVMAIVQAYNLPVLMNL